MAFDYNAGLAQAQQSTANAKGLGQVLASAGKMYGDYKSMQDRLETQDYLSALQNELNNPQNYNAYQQGLQEQQLNSLAQFQPSTEEQNNIKNAQETVQMGQGIQENTEQINNINNSLENMSPDDPKRLPLEKYQEYLQAEIDAANKHLERQDVQDNFRNTAYNIGMSVLTGSYKPFGGTSALSFDERMQLKEKEFENRKKIIDAQLESAEEKGYRSQKGRNEANLEFLPVKSSLLLQNQKAIADYKASLKNAEMEKKFSQDMMKLDKQIANSESNVKRLEDQAEAQTAADMVQEVIDFVDSDVYPDIAKRYGETLMDGLGVSSEYTRARAKIQQILTTKTKAILGDGRFTENEADKIQKKFGLGINDDNKKAKEKLQTLKKFLTPKRLSDKEYDKLFKEAGIERDKKTTSQPVKESKQPENKLTDADLDALWNE